MLRASYRRCCRSALACRATKDPGRRATSSAIPENLGQHDFDGYEAGDGASAGHGDSGVPSLQRRLYSLYAQQLLTLSSLLLPQSLTLMRNLLRTGISTICYMRDIFGDEEFSVRIWSIATASAAAAAAAIAAAARAGGSYLDSCWR